MTIVTENGWDQCDSDVLDRGLIPGTNAVCEILQGDVTTILKGFAAWYHRNVAPIDQGERDEWGWSRTNTVWNSNHLSGTAMDINSSQWPWQEYTMPQWMIDKIRVGLALFEGTVFWGRDWDRPDEMHFQIQGNAEQIAPFAAKLQGGYLNIWAAADPNEFPLPLGYYYGPQDGPDESVSGEWRGDSQAAKDGLGRWQEALGLPVTKKWNDGATSKAATLLQLDKGWAPHGHVGSWEWDAVIKDGWRLKAPLSVISDPEPVVVKWGDYSQYQDAFLDDSYPYPVIAFRLSIGDTVDEHAVEQMQKARDAVSRGKLQKVIGYHFFVPGVDNLGTFTGVITQTGGVFAELCAMVDVEDGGAKWGISGDQSAEVNELISKINDYFKNPQATAGYLNFNSNAELWQTRPNGIKLVVPAYNGADNEPDSPDPIFGHQYTDSEDTAPFGPTDMNVSKMPLHVWLSAWGVNDAAPSLAPAPVSIAAPAQAPPTPGETPAQSAPGATPTSSPAPAVTSIEEKLVELIERQFLP